ncbi:MAG: hypothetical protein LLF99_07765 [Desulfobacteraceae bacterium]|nr:hypothetical protein [Desulfobacteraceae bacterium]
MNAGYRKVLLPVLLILCVVCARASVACGPEFETAVFTGARNPDTPLEDYLQGRLGILQPTYARSYLFAAYRHLSGAGLSPDGQRAVLDLIDERISSWYSFGEFKTDSESHPTLKEWMEARSMAGGRGKEPVPEKTSGYSSFENCLRDSFGNAAATLRERIGRFGAESREVAEWVRGQDQVFANCSDREQHIPEPPPEGIDPLIARDRAYQIATAHFYAGGYDRAAELFSEIAGDAGSPWKEIAPYLEGRALVRKALSAADGKPAGGEDSREQAESGVREMFSRAMEQFQKVLDRSDLARWHPQARKMVNLVQYRLNPDERRRELARALLENTPGEVMKQDLSDYTWLMDGFSNLNSGEARPESGKNAARFSEMLEGEGDLTDWIFTFQNDGREMLDHALERYRTTKSLPWLLAAIARIRPEDPVFPAVLESARKVPADSPGYPSIGFHLARCLSLSGKTDEARSLADGLLSLSADRLPLSSRNLLMALRMRLARNLDEFLRFAQRIPVRFSFAGDHPFARIETAAGPGESGENDRLRKLMQGVPLFDIDAALAFNGMFPLQILAKTARSELLPEHLRLPLARAAWVRAVLLDRDDTALELAAYLKDRDPALRPLLSACLNARTRDAGKSAAVLAILRLPGLRPFLDAGLGRLTALDRIDVFRDNWWCSFDCKDSLDDGLRPLRYDYCREGDSLPDCLGDLYPAGRADFPAFLTAAEKDAALGERAALAAVGTAPNYLCSYAIAWAKREGSHPAVPEALHLAVRSTRYGCPDGDTTKLSKSAFELLHRKYPQSPWKKKTPYWY